MLQDFVNAIISAKNAITGTPPKSQQTQGWPLQQLPGANSSPVPGVDSNPVNDLGNAIAGGINTAANVVGKVPWVNVGNLDSSGKPITTIGNVYNNLAKNVNANGQILPQGKITAAELPMLAAGVLQQVAEPGSPEADTEDVAEEPQTFGETPTRASYMPPSKFNPPQEETPLTINEPESAPTIHGPAAPPPAVGSESPNNAGEPFSGENNLPPTEETVKTPIVQPEPNYERTYPSQGNEPNNRNIQIGGDVKPSDVKQINSTLNGYGVSGSQTDQLEQVEKLKGDLAKQATDTVTSEGGTTSSKDLLDTTAKNLQQTKVQSGLNDLATRGTANHYLIGVYNTVTGEEVTKLPDEIPDSTVLKMKVQMNQDAKPTFGQPDQTKWSTDQTVARYSRDVFDNIIDGKHPNVAQINNDMSDLYKSEDSLTSGANKESSEAYAKSQGQVSPVRRVVNTVGKTALTLGGIGTALELGDYALTPNGNATTSGSIKNNKNSNTPTGSWPTTIPGELPNTNKNIQNNTVSTPQTQASTNNGNNQTDNTGDIHTNSIAPVSIDSLPTKESDINIDPNKPASLVNPTSVMDNDNTPIVMSVGLKTAALNKIQDILNQNSQDPGTQNWANIKTQEINNRFAGSEPLLDEYNYNTNVINKINDALNFLNDPKNGFDDKPNMTDLIKLGPVNLQKVNMKNPNYASFIRSINTINSLSPQLGIGDPANMIDANAAKSTLTGALKNLITTFNQDLKNYKNGMPTSTPTTSDLPPVGTDITSPTVDVPGTQIPAGGINFGGGLPQLQ